MHNMTLRNVWLIAKREYLERVRTKAFLIFTLLTPALAITWAVLPSLMLSKKTGGTQHLVVATANVELGSAIKARIEEPPVDTDSESGTAQQSKQAKQVPGVNDTKYRVDVDTNVSDEERKALQARIDSKQIDAFLWLDQKSLDNHSLTYTARSVADFIELNSLNSAVRDALTKQRLHAQGLSPAAVEDVLKRFKIDTVQWTEGKATKTDRDIQFLSVFLLGFVMYMTVMIFGMSVMRSIVQEKTSRIMEVLMSTVSASDLMAGKILGVGAVGLTQIAIWGVMGTVAASPGATMAAKIIKQANYSLLTLVYFALFFLAGYFLYSSLCAALGAMVNSEQEAQQVQMFVMMPLIISFMFLFFAMKAPNDPTVVIVSMIPFAAPIIMITRIVAQTPPVWQIALSLTIMVVTTYLVLLVTSRIYRVGILMYGKRPTLPEIIKWIKYA
ncbi:MAG: hypothetical protein JWO13_594 [Acidobacteriales bacterium]|nr:hypothetical protein [Terriglobales bacterium]